ncbi:MAG: tetratricopeptide repeat protein [bacterium]|nr:tetratricopeptide repeat protein [bacterium]
MPTVIRRLIPVFAALCLIPTVAVADDYFQVTTLAPDLLLLSTDQGSYSNNSLVFTGKDGVLLVDTHHDSDVEAFKEFVDGLDLGVPKYIISTHRHVEHIGGNALFGPDPIILAHKLFPKKLRSGTFLFGEYPPESFPDITFEDSMEIHFNGELIRLANIGGSHDDNEIMVHFTNHKIAHVSSVVNGFNFPSVDGDGDVLQFERLTRRLMTLLPEDTRIVSGHHGKVNGFDFVGTWDMLPTYADMMRNTIEIVQHGLSAGKTKEQMQEAGVLDEYKDYAGSYVGTNGWINYVVDVLTVPKETRSDICKPIYDSWKKDGAKAAVARYRELLGTQEEDYDFSEYVLMSIGGKLYSRGIYEDSVDFFQGALELYPDAEYGYYTHYLAAMSYEKLGRLDEALSHCQESIRLKPDFAAASELMTKLEVESKE